jgi:hypothetical protein
MLRQASALVVRPMVHVFEHSNWDQEAQFESTQMQ